MYEPSLDDDAPGEYCPDCGHQKELEILDYPVWVCVNPECEAAA